MVVYKYPDNELRLGDVLVTLFDPFAAWAWAVGVGTKSVYMHTTIYVGNGMEWSVQERGSIIRPVGTDKIQVAFRPLIAEVGPQAARLAMSNPVKAYNWTGALWQGVQVLAGQENRKPLPWSVKRAKFCSEAVTDIYVAAGYDLVPNLENGATLPKDIPISSMMVQL